MTDLTAYTPGSYPAPYVELLEGMRQLRSDFTAMRTELRTEMRDDSTQLWGRIETMEKAIGDMNTQISSGKGVVQALVWVGGILLAIVSTASGLFSVFRR